MTIDYETFRNKIYKLYFLIESNRTEPQDIFLNSWYSKAAPTTLMIGQEE